MIANGRIKDWVVHFLCVSVLLAMNCVHASAAQKAMQADAPLNPHYWFSNSASKAKFIADPNTANRFTIVLEGVTPYVSYFTERPARQGGSMPLAQFVKLWSGTLKDNFREDPPNAAISGVPVKEKTGTTQEETTFTAAFELLDAQYDLASKTLSYSLKPLASSKTVLPTLMNLEHVTVFIDGVCLSCWDQ
jgi:hypothetical protein